MPIGLSDDRVVDHRWRRDIGLWIVVFFAAAATSCAALLAPVLWTAMTDGGQREALTLRYCASLEDSAGRLACYDRVARDRYRHLAGTTTAPAQAAAGVSTR